jgi:heme-degrading monooxygenase HmoA
MFSVIFEVFPHQERFEEYLALAKQLRPLLVQTQGFVDNERFASRRRPGWILSHSTWQDEKSVVRWRTTGEHHMVQEQGRTKVLQDYHLRVGDVSFDSDGPVHEQRFDETEVGESRLMTLTEIVPREGTEFGDDVLSQLGFDESSALEYDLFNSIYNPGKLALLVAWPRPSEWIPRKTNSMQSVRHRRIRIVRDYGMFDRREAPQFYPDAEGRETKHAALAPKPSGT